MEDMQQYMRAFGHQVTRDKVLLSTWRSLLDIMQHWDLKMKQKLTNLCGLFPSWPGSWLGWPPWCGPPPAGTSYGLSWRFLWPLSEQTPGSSLAQQLHAGASPVWATHILSLHYHVPAMKVTETINIILYYNINDLYAIVYYICNFCAKFK